MEGCEYCRMEPNGDIPDDRKELFSVKIGRIFGVDTFVYVSVFKNKMEMIDGNSFSKTIRIHYCPMCGRKL